MYEHRLFIEHEGAKDRPQETRRAANAPEMGLRVYRLPSPRPQVREARRWWR